MGVGYNPKIVTDEIVFYVDAANIKSYSGSGNWNDLSRNKATGSGTATFLNYYFRFNGSSNDFLFPNIDTYLTSINVYTVSCWVRLTSLSPDLVLWGQVDGTGIGDTNEIFEIYFDSGSGRFGYGWGLTILRISAGNFEIELVT